MLESAIITSTDRSVWASGGAYEPYVGRWSRLAAREFVDWLAVPPAARWLDLGCGTGALTETILKRANPIQVDGIDPSEGYLALAREQVRDPGTGKGVRNLFLCSCTAHRTQIRCDESLDRRADAYDLKIQRC